MKFNLNDEYIEEVLEILCAIYDTEPPTERHPGIEQMISQLAHSTWCNCQRNEIVDI